MLGRLDRTLDSLDEREREIIGCDLVWPMARRIGSERLVAATASLVSEFASSRNGR